MRVISQWDVSLLLLCVAHKLMSLRVREGEAVPSAVPPLPPPLALLLVDASDGISPAAASRLAASACASARYICRCSGSVVAVAVAEPVGEQ